MRLTFTKELRETLRDKRTIGVMVLFPLVVYPLLSLLTTQAVAMRATRQAEKPTRFGVAGPPALVAEVERMAAQEPARFAIVNNAHPEAVARDEIDAFVTLESATPKTPKTGDAPEPTARVDKPTAIARIHFNAGREDSRHAEARLDEALAALLPAGCARLFTVDRKDVGDETARGGYVLSKVLPLVIVLMLMLGAFYPAIDTTAGERERGTLETTFVAPVRRFDLLLGKVLAVTVLAALTGLLNLMSMSLTLVQAADLSGQGAAFPIPWGRVALTGLVLLPAALLFAALMVTVASSTRSFKEAQNLLTPLYFLLFIPAVVASLGDYELTPALALVPGLNLTLLARGIAVGQVHVGIATLVIVSTLAFAAAALALAARLFDSERLLSVEDRQRHKARGDSAPARPWNAADALVCGALGIITLFMSLPLQKRNLAVGLLAWQWGAMVGLIALYIRGRGLAIAPTVALRRARWRGFLAALVMASAAWIVVGLLNEWLVSPPRALVEKMKAMLLERPLPVALFLFAVTPAVCEEFLFRGAILQGLRRRFSDRTAIVVTAALFALFHLDLHRMLPTGLLGIMLGYIAVNTGSLAPAMLAHFTNNATLIILAAQGFDDASERMSVTEQAMALAVALIVVAAGAHLIRHPSTSKRL